MGFSNKDPLDFGEREELSKLWAEEEVVNSSEVEVQSPEQSGLLGWQLPSLLQDCVQRDSVLWGPATLRVIVWGMERWAPDLAVRVAGRE